MSTEIESANQIQDADIPLERDVFLRTLIRELAGTLQEVVGVEEASGFVSVVGQKIGEQIDQQYKKALHLTNLNRQQVSDVLVDLKKRIKGDFYIIEESDEKIVLGNRVCPFEDKVIGRPAMCMMTSNVFGGIAARNLGYAKVELKETIARGNSGCTVVVYLKPTEESKKSQRQRVLQTQRMTPEDFERIADVLPEPMLLVTVRGKVIAANQTLRQMLGTGFVVGRHYDVSEIFRTPGEQIKEYLRLCSGVRQFLPGSLKLHFYSEAELDLHCEGVGIDSSNFPEQLILLRLKAKTVAAERFRALNEQIELLNGEIGKRIKAEEIMRQQASLFDQVYDAIFVWQWKGPITFWNRGAERMYGFSRMEALGQISHKLLNTRTSRSMDRLLAELESQGQWEGELEHVTRDGRDINVETRMVLVREPGHAYVLEVNRDITARKHAEQELEKSFRREKAARELAEKANLAKDDFLASLSHELRTPLNPVLLIASDAADNPELAPEIRNNFETIRKNVELEARLIDDLLDLTRITHGKLSLHFRVTNARLIFDEAIANIQSDVHAKQIQMALNWHASQPPVYGDEVRLQQVFWNVLKNAVKFTPPKGKITIEAILKNGQLSVSITDTGIGMAQEEVERVFDAFAQGDHARTESHRFGGLGLGLAISRRLVEMHSGHIYARSEGRDKGSTFVIELPLAKIEAANPPLNENSAANAIIFSSERRARIRP